MAPKLTEAQHAVLSRMADGDEVWSISGHNPHCFWHGDLHATRPSFSTVHALWKRGFIESYKQDATGAQYRITPAGRAALTQEDV